MTRTLHADATTRSQAATLRPLWLLKLTTYSDKAAGTVDETFYFATHPVTYDYGNTGTDRVFVPALAGLSSLVHTLVHVPPVPGTISPTELIGRPLQITLANGPFDGVRLITTLRGHNLLAADVELSQLLLGAWPDVYPIDATALTGDEHTVLYRGEVARDAPITDERIELQCRVRPPEVAWILANHSDTPIAFRGTRLPLPLGEIDHVPAVTHRAGPRGTLNAAIDDVTTTIVVVSNRPVADWDLALSAIIGSEQITWTGATQPAGSPQPVQYTLTGVTRADRGTASAHAAGEQLIGFKGSSTFIVSGYAPVFNVGEALLASTLHSPESGLVRVNDTGWTETEDGAETGLTDNVAKITVGDDDAFDVLELMSVGAVKIGSQLTQSPESASGGVAGGTPDNVRDGNVASDVQVGTVGSNEDIEAFFDAPDLETPIPDTSPIITEQKIRVYKSQDGSVGGGRICSVRIVNSGVDKVEVGQIPNDNPNGWYQFTDTNEDGNKVELHAEGGGNSIWCGEIERIVSFLGTATRGRTAGTAAGPFLVVYSNVRGVEVPAADTSYTIAAALMIEHPADVLRYWVQEIAGETVDETSWAVAETNLTGDQLAIDARFLGQTWLEVALSLAYHCRSNLVSEETASGRVWKLLAANTSYAWPAAAGSITEWQGFAEAGRDLDEVGSRFRAFYNPDLAQGIEDEKSYAGVLVADPDDNDIPSQVPTADLEDAEEEFGRRDVAPYAFPAINDLPTAQRTLGYYVAESLRVAPTYAIRGVPWWEAYDLEVGDIVNVTPPWETSARKVRIIEVVRSFNTELIELRAVEVP